MSADTDGNGVLLVVAGTSHYIAAPDLGEAPPRTLCGFIMNKSVLPGGGYTVKGETDDDRGAPGRSSGRLEWGEANCVECIDALRQLRRPAALPETTSETATKVRGDISRTALADVRELATKSENFRALHMTTEDTAVAAEYLRASDAYAEAANIIAHWRGR